MVRSILAAVVVASSLSVPRSDAATPTTAVAAISPVDANGRLSPGYRITHHYGNANCESGSPTVGKAYQCFTPASPAGIYDSCWVQADHHYVVCVIKPWQHRVARLHVTRGYGDSSGFLTVHRPWGVRIGTGTRCLVILGPVHTIHGKRRTYLCNHKIVLAGPVSQHGDAWTVLEYRKVHHRGRPASYRRIGVRTAAVVWFGKPSTKD
jgi:hypothetical protein